MTPLVRAARPAEYTAIGELLVDTYGEFVTPEYLSSLRDVEHRAGLPSTELLVAIDPADGSMLGTATYTEPGSELLDALPPDTAAEHARHAGMRMLAVAKAARGNGVGSALVRECVARARLAGFAELALVTMDSMADAWRLYERHGFARTPERDKTLQSGMVLPAFVRPLTPWPIVRPARPEEFATVGDLTVNAYVDDGFVAAGDDYVPELRDAAHRAAHADLLVAVDRSDGCVLGTVTMCGPGSPYREVGRADEGEFRMLAVADRARGHGVGEALVRSVLERARSAGNRAVAMCSAEPMRTAHRLYERLGFRRDPQRDWEPLPGYHLLGFSREV